MKKIVINILLLLIVLLLSLLFLEGFLRIYYPQKIYGGCYGENHPESNGTMTQFDERFGWFTKPNYVNCFYQETTNRKNIHIHNSKGLRLEREVSYSSEGRIRIALLGDSFSYGIGLNQSSTLAYKLQKKLGEKYGVIPFGVPGYSTEQEFILLKEEVLKYNPDIVLLGYFQNDFVNNIEFYTAAPKPRLLFDNNRLMEGDLSYYYKHVIKPEIRKKELNPIEEKKFIKFLLERSHLFSLIAHSSPDLKSTIFPNKISYLELYKNNTYVYDNLSIEHGLGQITHDLVYEKEDDELYLYGMGILNSLLVAFKIVSENEDFNFIVVNFPQSKQISSTIQKEFISGYRDVDEDFFDFNKHRKDFGNIVRDLEIDYLDLFPSFDGRRDLYLIKNLHISEKGIDVAVDEIYKKLEELGWLELAENNV